MKCPKCGYVSHDYLNACRKCSVDLMAFKAQMQLHVVQSGHIDLRSVLGGVPPGAMASGEFATGESLFDSPMLVETHGENGFDISLEDDFSFTPSGMSLESLDGLELPNTDSMNPERHRDASGRPDTGYATVMMDISGLDGGEPPRESAGDMSEAPIESAGPAFVPPTESAGGVIELPELPSDDALVEPDLTSAELRSSVGHTSDLDLTSMELKRTTRDIEMLNQLKNESPADEAELPFTPTLPESFPAAEAGAEDLGDESGELILPSLDAGFFAADASADSTTPVDSPADAPAEKFAMPELPELDADEKPIKPYAEATSFADDSMMASLDAADMASEEPPLDFPSLQTGILPPALPSEETTLIDESPSPSPGQPTSENDASLPPDTGSAAPKLELGNPDLPKPADAFLTATPEETTLADEPRAPLPIEPTAKNDAVARPDTGFATTELRIGDTQPPEAPSEAPVFPDLPEETDALFTAAPEAATFVDQPSPFSPTGHRPVDVATEPSDTGYTTIELDMSDVQEVELDMSDVQEVEIPDEAPAFPDLLEQTEAFLTPSPEEMTLVDEPSPFLPTGSTPVDFTIAPPNSEDMAMHADADELDEGRNAEPNPETSRQKSQKHSRHTDSESSQ